MAKSEFEGSTTGYKVPMQSPNLVAEPYRVPKKLTILSLFKTEGWSLLKQKVLSGVRSLYCMAKLTRHVQNFRPTQMKEIAQEVYQLVNSLHAEGNTFKLRQVVTDPVYTQMKREVKQRQGSSWAKVQWELAEMKKMNIVQARLVANNADDTDNAFAQVTVEFDCLHRFAVYDGKNNLVAGSPDQLLKVIDYWVLERPLSGNNVRWRMAARITV
eukprot:CAMPEP_0196587442 /NCGR_PEP_ID=MMETSP1081-20130531/57497_1 /TAXON_ID=36882 /ORGANISM="Pyramimonas amylifera, Strain CCMP720" /LENGTH=213 /DNA_ID=CAMNT_0041909629 /DNA_START=396 /DNA_END=1037 /DNA_ORIENTATION=+